MSLPIAALVSVLVFVPFSSAFADRPAENSLPLSSILAKTQSQLSGVIVEAEYDDGRWELKACQQNGCQKAYVNPQTGDMIGQKPSGFELLPTAGGKTIQQVVAQVEAANLGVLSSVEFDKGRWEVKLLLAE